MRMLRWPLVMLCSAALSLPSCGSESDSTGGQVDAPPDEPALTEVPDVIGEDAETATSDLEAEGFTATYDPEPDDPSLCDVTDQDQSGEVEEGAEILLTLECRVDVPDMTGETVDDAAAGLEELGLTVSYEEEPDDTSVCTVEEQDTVGEAEPESGIVLSVLCEVPDVTNSALDSAVSDLELAGYEASYSYVEDSSVCSVASQDPEGEAEPGAEITLNVECGDGYGDDGY